MWSAIAGKALAWLGLNKVLLLVAVAGIAAAGGVFLWYRAQVADLRAELAERETAIAVSAAKSNADAVAEVKRIAEANGAALARFLEEQRARQADLAAQIMEISNAPIVGSCPVDPVLDRTIDRVWGETGAAGAGGQGRAGGDRRGAAPALRPAAGARTP